jgi:hypothetical protein
MKRDTALYEVRYDAIRSTIRRYTKCDTALYEARYGAIRSTIRRYTKCSTALYEMPCGTIQNTIRLTEENWNNSITLTGTCQLESFQELKFIYNALLCNQPRFSPRSHAH